jgi:hypothetical protein
MLLQAAQLFENLRIVLEDAGMDWGGVCVCGKRRLAAAAVFSPLL